MGDDRSLPPNNGIYLYIYFTVDPNPPGTDVENCATFNGLSNNLTLNPVCTTFKVGDYQPIPCVLKEICSPKESYDPGNNSFSSAGSKRWKRHNERGKSGRYPEQPFHLCWQ